MGKYCLGWGVDGSRSWGVAGQFSVMPGCAGYSDSSEPESQETRRLNESFTFSRLQWGDNATAVMTGKQLRLMKNGVASGLTATGPDSTAGPTWLPNSYTGGPVSFAATDTFAVNGVQSDDPFNGIQPYAFNTVVEASGGQVALYSHQRLGGQSLMSTNTESYHSICSGDSVQNKTSANQGVRISTAGTLKDAICYVVTNNAADDLHIKSYINGSPGNIDIIIPAGQTGEFTDFTNTDTLNVGDVVQWQATIAVGASVYVSYIGCSIESGTNGVSDYFAHISKDTGFTIGQSPRRYTKAYGQVLGSSTIAARGAGIGFNATISGLWVHVESNVLTGSDEFRWGFRKGSTDLGTFLTINQASGTGFIVDGVNSFSVGADEEIAIWWEGDVYPGITIRAYGWTGTDLSVSGGGGGSGETYQAFVT